MKVCALLTVWSLLAFEVQGQPQLEMAVSVDDLPVNSLAQDVETWSRINTGLLDTLTSHQIPAIGFVNENKLYDSDVLTGAKVALLRQWLQAGLELGNHGYAHLDAHRVPLAAFLADIGRGDLITGQLAREEGGVAGRYFRHPYLHTGRTPEYREAIESYLNDWGYRVAPVTIDNQEYIFARAYARAVLDGEDDLPGRIADAYVDYMLEMLTYYEDQAQRIVGRSIRQVLLIHANRLNADHLDSLVTAIKARGYTFVTLDRALEDPAYASADGYFGPAGITWLHRWAISAGKTQVFGEEPAVPDFVQEAYAN